MKAYSKAMDLAFFEYIKWQISDFLLSRKSEICHTWMVNEQMNQLADSGHRVGWLRNLTRMPVTLESAPTAIYNLLQTSQHCRKVAKALASQRDIFGTLNERLNLVDVANTKISADNYMTLLVHLGVASVHLKQC